MATRSTIWIKKANGKYDGIYCHWDGYPDGVGTVLKEHFTDVEKVKALIELGAISQLWESIDCPVGHCFDSPAPNCTIAYHRDRGEELEVWRDMTISELFTEDYNYIFNNGKWKYFKWDNRKSLKTIS